MSNAGKPRYKNLDNYIEAAQLKRLQAKTARRFLANKQKTMKTITERKYWEMFEVLPPEEMASHNHWHGFLVGEPTNHNKDGQPQYQSYFYNDVSEFYIGDVMDTPSFKKIIKETDTLNEQAQDATPIDDDTETELKLREEYSDAHIDAAIACDVSLDDFEEAYQGEYSSDEDFAMEMADELGCINTDASWPNSYIDWERAARDLMMDYSTDNGFYFRCLWNSKY